MELHPDSDGLTARPIPRRTLISGTATTSGVFAVTVTVSDGVAVGQATFGWTVNDPSPPTGVVEVRVSSGVDDVEEIAATGEMYLQSSDLELIDDSSYKGVQTVGMRFNGVVVPAGSTITAAYLEFQADEADTRATSLAFRAQAGDDAAPFGSAAFDLSNRSVTAAAVSWSNVPAWNTVGQKHQTPDLSAVVQEVIDWPGWSSGNSVVIAVTGSGRRVAESANGDATNAPLLHIEYTDGTPGNSVPVVTSPAPQTSTVGDVVSLGVVATDADGDVLSFVASGLPDGLSIGTTDGVISGTATTAGVFAVTVTASDGAATDRKSVV